MSGLIVKEGLSGQIYRNLRTALMDGAFRPGERLTIAGLAKRYGTSSTPVREAIFRLASEHALEVKAATSVVVPNLTIKNLREIVAVRRQLEGLAAYRFAEIATEAQIASLEARHEVFIEAAAHDPKEAAQLNRDFHFEVLRSVDLPYIEAICENMWMLMGPFLRVFHEQMAIRSIAADGHQHHLLLQAARARKPEDAMRAMQADIAWSDDLINRHEAILNELQA